MTNRNEDRIHLRKQYQRKGFALGMVVFLPIGIAFSLIFDNSITVASGIALGLLLGPAIGEYLYHREISRERMEKEKNRESH
jgi:hypothetical protein